MAIAYVYVQVFDCEHEAFWSCERAGAGHGNGGGWVHGTLRKIADHCELSTTCGSLRAIRTVLEDVNECAMAGIQYDGEVDVVQRVSAQLIPALSANLRSRRRLD